MKKLLDKFSKKTIWLIIIIFSIVYSFISIVKHNHFQTGLDLGIYVQTFWSYIHLTLPRVTFYPTNGDLVWADHFTPSLILLAPFYFIWSDPKILLILQAVLIVIGGYPIYSLAKELLKNEFLSLSIVLSYLLFFGTQFALTFDFHSATYGAIFLPWLFLFMFRKKWKSFLIIFLIAMGAKEDMPLLLSAISIYLVLTKKNIPLGIFLSVVSILYVYLVTKFIMPSLSVLSAKIYYTPSLPKGVIDTLSVFIDSPIKVKTLMLSFASFLFLPFLSGWFLIVAIFHFFINFISKEFSGRWDIYLHYRIHLASILAVGTILGTQKLLVHIKNYDKNMVANILEITLLIATLGLDILLHLPVNTLLKPAFYRNEQWMSDNFDVMKKIPKYAYLLTQNDLAPHVANRKNLFYFPTNLDKAEYIFLDLRANQPIVNFWLSGLQDKTESDVDLLIKRGKFTIDYQKGRTFLLKRAN